MIYLSLGTNLGNKEENLRNAVDEINKRVGNVVSLSAFYETEPWGFDSDNTFLNAALAVDTKLSPFELLAVTKKIEKQLGRTAKSINKSYADRIIDIDILLYNDLILNTNELVLPHPLMTQRSFVMEPLVEIAPDVIHPVLLKTMKEL
ncbi:2-amino-4-hydroxy-6-hydroxymethyldihydropteridine diphosphokinase [Bacteroides sp. 519]|uniref:2-amino-4-hydroxy-6- hydroxymethyldihydropteridine diphosphokinase n=1 Tax=Bacteroides sp. 519 TaxID=2302937 RepID=UPI0013D23B40|nr:2-amino-4-hydroxy-6-hydroxymethyldihydropteridine diphosphokinase [Bacteroides sp. 519]NDV57551.1 2-amino-4-hydroxy-6-hydroxymethyldihydropteridine diphosphokinase [Bacteroides sp. 519]